LYAPLDEPRRLKIAQTLGQEGLWHERHAAADIVKAVSPEHQLAQHKQRPAFGQDLCRLRNRAILTIASHPRQSTGRATQDQVHFLHLIARADSLQAGE
jgi:hypothetical protein